MSARFRDEIATLSSARESTSVAEEPDRVQVLQLADGRELAWSEYGHRHGYPLVYLHRQAGSRVEAKLLHESALSAGFRLIAVDRPGIGYSSFKPLHDIRELVGDYQQLIIHLDIDQAGLVSWGAGSVLALEIARCLKPKISLIHLISPLRLRSGLPEMPWLRGIATTITRLLLSSRARSMKRAEAEYLSGWREQLSYADKGQVDDPWFGSLMAEVARQSLRQGSAGAAQDLVLSYCRKTLPAPGVMVPVHEWSVGSDHSFDLLTPDLMHFCTRHRVCWQGQLFIKRTAPDIMNVARKSLALSSLACAPVLR
jgi:pimeloyl-ACP methyl ester carboxylesterase